MSSEVEAAPKCVLTPGTSLAELCHPSQLLTASWWSLGRGGLRGQEPSWSFGLCVPRPLHASLVHSRCSVKTSCRTGFMDVKGPMLRRAHTWLNALLSHCLEILNPFRTRGPACSVCTGPSSCVWSCLCWGRQEGPQVLDQWGQTCPGFSSL